MQAISAGALAALRGNRVETFTYELHRLVPDAGVLKWTIVDSNLQLVRECSISQDRIARIKRNATFKIIETPTINFLTDEIRVKWNVRAATPGATVYQFTMGTFAMNSPNLPLLKHGQLREVTCYDLLVYLDQATLEDWLTVPAGDNVTITVINILSQSFPNAGILIPLSPLVFDAPKIFEAGMPLLDVCNRMLAYAGYTSLRCDVNGSYVATPYVSPQDRTSEFTFADDSFSLFVGDGSVFEQDIFDCPTEFIRTVSKPGAGAPYPLISQYNIPSGPFSAAARHRQISNYASVDVADQVTLDTLAKAEGEEMMLRHTLLHFPTPLMPMDWADCVTANYSRLPAGYNGLNWIGRSWTFPCIPGGVMDQVAETTRTAS